VFGEVNTNNESFWKVMPHSLEVMQHSLEYLLVGDAIEFGGPIST